MIWPFVLPPTLPHINLSQILCTLAILIFALFHEYSKLIPTLEIQPLLFLSSGTFCEDLCVAACLGCRYFQIVTNPTTNLIHILTHTIIFSVVFIAILGNCLFQCSFVVWLCPFPSVRQIRIVIFMFSVTIASLTPGTYQALNKRF